MAQEWLNSLLRNPIYFSNFPQRKATLPQAPVPFDPKAFFSSGYGMTGTAH